MIKKKKGIFSKILAVIMALTMVVGFIPAKQTETVHAAASKKNDVGGTKVRAYGNFGSIKLGNKTKSGTWWKITVDDKEAFCLSLGKTCHDGENNYSVSEVHNWNQDTKGTNGLYAKIIRWYVNDTKRSKKGFVFSQALMWSVAEGGTTKKELTDVISTMQTNTGYYGSTKAADLYKKIFSPSGNWTATAAEWRKTSGDTNSWQTLYEVGAAATPSYQTEDDSLYYRQRITVLKKGETGNGLDNIRFNLTASNLDDLYSFQVSDNSGISKQDADESDDGFSIDGLTKPDGRVAWRMTYKIKSGEKAYYSDDQLKKMNDAQKKSAKDQLEDDGYKEGKDFGKNMTQKEADALVKKDLNDMYNKISNSYTLTEKDTSAHPEIVKDPTYAQGVSITLGVNNSWKKNKNGDWPETGTALPSEYTGAYIINPLINKTAKGSIKIIKTDAITGKALDGQIDGQAQYQIFSDEACTTPATVYKEDGTTIPSPVYKVGEERTETDYLAADKNYWVKEVKAPAGFHISDKVFALNMSLFQNKPVEYTKDVQTIAPDDQPFIGNLTLKKSGDMLTGFDEKNHKFTYSDRNLKDAVFEITAAEDEKDPDDISKVLVNLTIIPTTIGCT